MPKQKKDKAKEKNVTSWKGVTLKQNPKRK
jgi:hypothetical protein